MAEIVLSTSADTRAEGQILAKKLEKKGFTTWLDSGNLEPDRPSHSQFREEVGDSRACLVLVGNGPTTDQQRREWQAAISHVWTEPQAMLIPVIVRQAEAPSFLTEWPPIRVDDSVDDTHVDLIVQWLEKGSPPAELGWTPDELEPYERRAREQMASIQRHIDELRAAEQR